MLADTPRTIKVSVSADGYMVALPNGALVKNEEFCYR